MASLFSDLKRSTKNTWHSSLKGVGSVHIGKGEDSDQITVSLQTQRGEIGKRQLELTAEQFDSEDFWKEFFSKASRSWRTFAREMGLEGTRSERSWMKSVLFGDLSGVRHKFDDFYSLHEAVIRKRAGLFLKLAKGESLEDLRQQIEDEAPNVDVAPYSHNIINIVLQQIAEGYGDEEANKAIEDLGLEDLGWVKKELESVEALEEPYFHQFKKHREMTKEVGEIDAPYKVETLDKYSGKMLYPPIYYQIPTAALDEADEIWNQLLDAEGAENAAVVVWERDDEGNYTNQIAYYALDEEGEVEGMKGETAFRDDVYEKYNVGEEDLENWYIPSDAIETGDKVRAVIDYVGLGMEKDESGMYPQVSIDEGTTGEITYTEIQGGFNVRWETGEETHDLWNAETQEYLRPEGI